MGSTTFILIGVYFIASGFFVWHSQRQIRELEEKNAALRSLLGVPAPRGRSRAEIDWFMGDS